MREFLEELTAAATARDLASIVRRPPERRIGNDYGWQLETLASRGREELEAVRDGAEADWLERRLAEIAMDCAANPERHRAMDRYGATPFVEAPPEQLTEPHRLAWESVLLASASFEAKAIALNALADIGASGSVDAIGLCLRLACEDFISETSRICIRAQVIRRGIDGLAGAHDRDALTWLAEAYSVAAGRERGTMVNGLRDDSRWMPLVQEALRDPGMSEHWGFLDVVNMEWK